MSEEPRFPERHRWPVSVSFRGVTLAPFRHRDIRGWEGIRSRNRSWLQPWDATTPPGAVGPPMTYTAMVSTYRREARAGRMLPWLVWVRDGEAPVMAGQLTVSGIQHGAASWGSIGYWIDQRWAGRGVTPTAVALASDYCFRVVGLHRIDIAIRPENGPSLRVVEKLGFRYEGSRARYLHIDGDWRDHECFALHREDVPGGLWRRLPAGVPRLGD